MAARPLTLVNEDSRASFISAASASSTAHADDGRLRRTGARARVPLAKKWVEPVNTQAGKAPLVETLPAGVRNKRAIGMWVVVGLFFIAVVATISITGYLFVLLHVDAEGLAALQITPSRVRVGDVLQVTEGVTVGGPPAAGFTASLSAPALDETQRAGTPRGNLTVEAAGGSQTWQYVGAVNTTDSALHLAAAAASITTQTLRFVASDAAEVLGTNPPCVATEASLDINTARVVFDVETATIEKVSAARVVAPLEGSLELSSPGAVSLSSLHDLTVESRGRSVNIGALQGITLEAAREQNTGFTKPLVLDAMAGVFLDLDQLAKPVNAIPTDAFTLCVCGSDSGRLFLTHADRTCGDWIGVYTADPCL